MPKRSFRPKKPKRLAKIKKENGSAAAAAAVASPATNQSASQAIKQEQRSRSKSNDGRQQIPPVKADENNLKVRQTILHANATRTRAKREVAYDPYAKAKGDFLASDNNGACSPLKSEGGGTSGGQR